MIKRRCTYAYFDFVYGKFRSKRNDDLLRLVRKMTSDERLDIDSMDFGRMWYRIWRLNPEEESVGERMNTAYNLKKKKFKKEFEGNPDRIKAALNASKPVEGTWEFPKGRREKGEGKLNCAIREFVEETGVNTSEIHFLREKVQITYTENGKWNIVLYLAYVDKRLSGIIDHYNVQQLCEVAEMGWKTLPEIKKLDTSGRYYGLAVDIARIMREKYSIAKIAAL